MLVHFFFIWDSIIKGLHCISIVKVLYLAFEKLNYKMKASSFHTVENASEYYQKMQQSQITDQPMAPYGGDIQTQTNTDLHKQKQWCNNSHLPQQGDCKTRKKYFTKPWQKPIDPHTLGAATNNTIALEWTAAAATRRLKYTVKHKLSITQTLFQWRFSCTNFFRRTTSL